VSQPGSHGRTLESGKLPPELLAALISAAPDLPPEVRLGARIGEDASAIDVQEGTLVVAADPITLTASDVARLSVLVNANDVAVCGARPRWFLAVVLVPPATSEGSIRDLFSRLHAALAEVGVALVGGHTEVTPAVTQPIVFGTMLGITERGAIVETAGLAPGDLLLQVRPVPIEGAAVLANEAAAERLAAVDPQTLALARAALDDPGISVVEPALLATQLGASALHDPTEGGLLMGLHEMAVAGDVGLRLDPDAVLWFEPGLAVCAALGGDPWSTLASGTLLAAFPESVARHAASTFEDAGHAVAVLASVERGRGMVASDGTPMSPRERDEVARILSS
jgi:hydrogenase expression/formation protein HypE